ncbi:MAG: hypothetical protein RL637_630 [Pseudomonadota bacterium]|jgi:hypothetical protein
MNPHLFKARWFRYSILLILILSLNGCLYWIRAYQTYLQLSNFDQNFSIEDQKQFTVYFKHPILYNQDLVSLSKLQPSHIQPLTQGSRWRYIFRKVDVNQKLIQPELNFFFDLDFNAENRVTQWTFSPLFLQIAPPKFLEVSLRSLAGGEINKTKRQLHANAAAISKIHAELPQKNTVISQLGAPIDIQQQNDQEIYIYHFLLETHDIEAGYEDRALSIVKLTFDKNTHELIQMGGRFAGLKISIHYRQFLADENNES